MTLPLPVMQTLEKAIEAVLRMDPDTQARLRDIDGKVVRVNISRPAISIMLCVVNGQVHLSMPDDTQGLDPSADTTISGHLMALRSLIDDNNALYTGDVKIEGDIGTSQHLKQILGKLDPDWQDAVAPYLGDQLTHRLDVAQTRFTQWLKRTREGTRLNASDYLQEEVELLAPNSEVRRFCHEVDDIRSAADRLAARVQQHEAMSRARRVED